jgi:hypothetical protein
MNNRQLVLTYVPPVSETLRTIQFSHNFCTEILILYEDTFNIANYNGFSTEILILYEDTFVYEDTFNIANYNGFSTEILILYEDTFNIVQWLQYIDINSV